MFVPALVMDTAKRMIHWAKVLILATSALAAGVLSANCAGAETSGTWSSPETILLPSATKPLEGKRRVMKVERINAGYPERFSIEFITCPEIPSSLLTIASSNYFVLNHRIISCEPYGTALRGQVGDRSLLKPGSALF